MPGILILLLIVVVVAIAIGSAKTREALNRSWRSVAERFDLQLTAAEWNRSPRLVGDVEGYPLVIDIEKRGSGKHKSAWTRFRLGVPALNLGLELKEEGFLSQISKVFGGKDIEVGDAAFDDRLQIKGDDARAIRAFLNPERRAEIEKFFSAHRGTVINDQGISWARHGRVAKTPQLIAVVDEMLRVGRALAPPDEQLSSAAAAATGWSAAVALAPINARFEAESESAATTTADPPTSLSAHEPHRDSRAQLEFRSESESAAQPDQARERGGRSDGEAQIEAESDPPSRSARSSGEAQPALAASSVGLAEFCAAVFAPGALSYAAAQAFRENYQGQSVVWSGTLRSAETYGFDFVFGSGGGVKAIVELRRQDEAAPGTGAVKAVVQLPADTAGLEALEGERVTFTGSLIKVDGLERQVFVSQGRLGRQSADQGEQHAGGDS